MESSIKERTVIDIGKTAEKHESFVNELLPSHAGCDKVGCCYGVGKGTALKVLKAGHYVTLGVFDSPKESVIEHSSQPHSCQLVTVNILELNQ